VLLILEGRVLYLYLLRFGNSPADSERSNPRPDGLLLHPQNSPQLCVAKIVDSSHSSFANTLLDAPLQSLVQPQGPHS
jgi:hypothetical protein